MRRKTWLGPVLGLATLATVLWFEGSGCSLIYTFDRDLTNEELQCSSTLVSDFGWVERLSSSDEEACALSGDCPRFFNYCEGTTDEAGVRGEWEKVVAEVVGGDTFRGQPGPWCITGTTCEVVTTFTGDASELPACRPASTAVAFDHCAPASGCLSLSQGSLDFGYVEMGSASAGRFVRVENVCEEAVNVVVDQDYTCDDATRCSQCAAGDPACQSEYVITTDCLPAPGETSHLLEGAAAVDPLARSCQIGVVFQPAERGERQARKIFATESGDLYQIELMGTGLGGMAGFVGPEEVCRDAGFIEAARDCTAPDDNAVLRVQNLGPQGGLRVSGYDLDPDVGFWVQFIERVNPATGERETVELPVSLAVDEELQLRVRYCLSRSATSGLEAENTLLLIHTDDYDGDPTYTVALRWLPTAGGCG